MGDDIFGSLLDWGRVVDQIAELKEAGKLEEHQKGLRRILRYPDNWRLRETVLETVKDLTAPSEEIISEVLAIMMDANIYWQTRALAADALSRVVGEKKGVRESIGPDLVRRVIEGMKAILAAPQPPAFHDAIRKSSLVIGTHGERTEV